MPARFAGDGVEREDKAKIARNMEIAQRLVRERWMSPVDTSAPWDGLPQPTPSRVSFPDGWQWDGSDAPLRSTPLSDDEDYEGDH
jgi:hypothetical protein